MVLFGDPIYLHPPQFFLFACVHDSVGLEAPETGLLQSKGSRAIAHTSIPDAGERVISLLWLYLFVFAIEIDESNACV
uniref:OB_NTP_bind domain-containing protein n=1 Tax=Panagrellus redivivus TaxID=6233 RepID=A0A7E4ZXR7_PANRE